MAISVRGAAETPRPMRWQRAMVLEVRAETPSAKTFRLALADPRRRLPGQHYIVRLIAPDGYRAQRSYSVASAPDGAIIELTVEDLPDWEISGFLRQVVEPGDQVEVRGPVGGYFSWDGRTPAIGVAGASGVVPIMAVLRTTRHTSQPGLIRVIVSVRAPGELYYPGELPAPDATVVYTARLSRAPRVRQTASREGSRRCDGQRRGMTTGRGRSLGGEGRTCRCLRVLTDERG